MQFLELANKNKIIPVVAIENIEHVIPLCEALVANGMPIIEIVLRTEYALDAIALAKVHFPQMTVIAGSVKNANDAELATKAGADMIVSAGLNPNTISKCQEMGIEIVPGVCTPSEIEQGLELGISVMKFFPAEASGGITRLAAMASVYNHVKFMPTGGITPQNAKNYLSMSSVVCCGGSWIADKTLMQSKNWNALVERIKHTVKEFNC